MTIPAGTARATNMSVGSGFDVAVDASGRYDDQCPIHLHAGKRRTALGAEALLMPRGGDTERLDLVLARQPLDRCRRGKEVGRVRRPGVLPTPPAMAQEEALESAENFEPDCTAETRAHVFIAHRIVPLLRLRLARVTPRAAAP